MRSLIIIMCFSMLWVGGISQAQQFSPSPSLSSDSLNALLAPTPDILLDVEEAFSASIDVINHEQLVVRWDIADGYYLYRQRFQFSVDTPGLQLGEPVFPLGQWQEDEFFGEVEIYRHQVAVKIPLIWSQRPVQQATLELQTQSQGCADVGVCYPPHQERIPVILSAN